MQRNDNLISPCHAINPSAKPRPIWDQSSRNPLERDAIGSPFFRSIALQTTRSAPSDFNGQAILACTALESQKRTQIGQRKTLQTSHLPIQSLKIHPFLQKKRGPAEIILHIILRFSVFFGFSPLQAVAFQ
jgi:hypothetical protein